MSPVAVAARRLDRTSSNVSVHSTSLRSMLLVKIASVNPAMAPTTAVAVTVWPAAPSVMLRSLAMRVSRLAGRNSAVTRPNTPSDRETTAAQSGSVRSSEFAGASRSATADAVSDMRILQMVRTKIGSDPLEFPC